MAPHRGVSCTLLLSGQLSDRQQRLGGIGRPQSGFPSSWCLQEDGSVFSLWFLELFQPQISFFLLVLNL